MARCRCVHPRRLHEQAKRRLCWLGVLPLHFCRIEWPRGRVKRLFEKRLCPSLTHKHICPLCLSLFAPSLSFSLLHTSLSCLSLSSLSLSNYLCTLTHTHTHTHAHTPSHINYAICGFQRFTAHLTCSSVSLRGSYVAFIPG